MTTIEVSRHNDRWAVRVCPDDMPIGEYETFQLAEAAAKHRAKECGGDVVIHDADDGRLGTGETRAQDDRGGHIEAPAPSNTDPRGAGHELQGGL